MPKELVFLKAETNFVLIFASFQNLNKWPRYYLWFIYDPQDTH